MEDTPFKELASEVVQEARRVRYRVCVIPQAGTTTENTEISSLFGEMSIRTAPNFFWITSLKSGKSGKK